MTAREDQLARISALKTLGQVRDYWDSEHNPYKKAARPKGRNSPLYDHASSRHFDRQMHEWRESGEKYFTATAPAILYDDNDESIRIVIVEVGHFDQNGDLVPDAKYDAYLKNMAARSKEIEEAVNYTINVQEAIRLSGLKPTKAGQEMKTLLHRIRVIDALPGETLPEMARLSAEVAAKEFFAPAPKPSFSAKLKVVWAAIKGLFR